MLFAAAFYVVAVFLVSVVVVVAVASPLFLLGAVLPWDLPAPTVLLVVAVGVSVVLALPHVVDRVWGARIDPDGYLARWIRTTHRFNLWCLGLVAYGPAQYTLMSRIGGRRAAALLILVLTGITGTFLVRDVMVERERLEFGILSFAPEVPGAAGVDPRYYESQWVDDPPPLPVPSISTDVLDDETAWVRLFVPFRPTADPDAVAALCPDLAPVARTGPRFVRPERGIQTDTLDAAIAPSLRCVAGLWDVSLDDVGLVAPPVFATHPVTRLPGLSWYLDVRGLTPGRHVLRVARSAAAHQADIAGDDDPRPPRRHAIPFWR